MTVKIKGCTDELVKDVILNTLVIYCGQVFIMLMGAHKLY